MKCKDELMREAHPGLQDLWEQYLTMYKLLDDGSIQEEETVADVLARVRARGQALKQTEASITKQIEERKKNESSIF